MKVAVYGAAGWVGRAVLAALQGRHSVRAIDLGEAAWQAQQDRDGDWHGDKVVADVRDFAATDAAMEGMDAVVHAAAFFNHGAFPTETDTDSFMVNLKGLWNVLEAAKRRGVRRVVHIGSCHAVHPKGVFLTPEVRRPDGSIYAVSKRLQEEMCRQYHDAFGTSIAVMRVDSIVDSRLGQDKYHRKLGSKQRPYMTGWICRHDLAEACRLAVEHPTLEFDILHIVGTPEASATCDVDRARQVLDLTYQGSFERYR